MHKYQYTTKLGVLVSDNYVAEQGSVGDTRGHNEHNGPDLIMSRITSLSILRKDSAIHLLCCNRSNSHGNGDISAIEHCAS